MCWKMCTIWVHSYACVCLNDCSLTVFFLLEPFGWWVKMANARPNAAQQKSCTANLFNKFPFGIHFATSEEDRPYTRYLKRTQFYLFIYLFFVYFDFKWLLESVWLHRFGHCVATNTITIDVFNWIFSENIKKHYAISLVQLREQNSVNEWRKEKRNYRVTTKPTAIGLLSAPTIARIRIDCMQQ